MRSAGVEGQILRSTFHNICFIAAQPPIVEIRTTIPAIKSQSYKNSFSRVNAAMP